MDKQTDQVRSDGIFRYLLAKVQSVVRLCILLTVCATVFSLAAHQSWLADLVANLRIQQLIGGCVFGLLCLLVKDYRFAALSASCVLVTTLAIAVAQQHLQPSGEDAGASDSFAVMTINVLTTNQRHDEISRQILDARPDAVAILELGTSLADHLQQAISKDYPHHLQQPSDRGNFGIGLWSRLPMKDAKLFQLNESITSISARIAGTRLVATHPLPPVGKVKWNSRNDHLRQLALRVSEHRQEFPSQPIVVMGDLNLTPWSPLFPEFQTQSQLLRAAPRWSLAPTWYVIDGWFPMGLVLDHVLATDDLTFDEYVVGDETGSDHRSVFVRLRRMPNERNIAP